MIILTQRRRERRGAAENYRPAGSFGSPPQAIGTMPRSAPHPSKGRGPWQGGRGVEVTDPTPRYAHPSPTMGGELSEICVN